MRFVDYNNNGGIDPTDIGIGAALDDEEEVPTRLKSAGAGGCIITVLTLTAAIAGLVISVAALIC